MSFVRSQIANFPASWDVLPFERAFSDVTGGQPKIQARDYLHSGLIPIIDQGKEFIAGYVDNEDLICEVQLPVILFGDHTRIFKFVDHPFALGADGVKVLLPAAGIDARFAYYYLRQVKLPEDLGYSRHFKYLKDALVPVPSREEQRRIADVLDKADAIRRKRKEAIALTEELLRSVFLEMFGDPVANPKGWHVSSVGDEVEMLEYGPRFYNEKYADTGVRIVRITDLDVKGTLNFEAMPKLVVEEEDLQRHGLRAGDILFARTGATVGKTALIEPSDPIAIAGAYFVRLRFKDRVHPNFARMVLASDHVQKMIVSRSRQSAQPNFSGPGIRVLPMPLPPRALQKKFDEIVTRQKTLITQFQKGLQAAEHLFKSLMHRAFQGTLSTSNHEAGKQLGLFNGDGA